VCPDILTHTTEILALSEHPVRVTDLQVFMLLCMENTFFSNLNVNGLICAHKTLFPCYLFNDAVCDKYHIFDQNYYIFILLNILKQKQTV